MTITREVFAANMAAFQDRFKVLQPVTLAMYYKVVDRELSDAEFTVGIERSLSWDGYGIPGPQQIVDLAKPRISRAVEAAKAYETVMGDFSHRPWQEFRLPLTGVVRHAIIASGGVKAMALMDEKAAPHVRRTFVEAYEQFASDSDSALQADRTLASIDPRARQIVEQTTKQIGGSR